MRQVRITVKCIQEGWEIKWNNWNIYNQNLDYSVKVQISAKYCGSEKGLKFTLGSPVFAFLHNVHHENINDRLTFEMTKDTQIGQRKVHLYSTI